MRAIWLTKQASATSRSEATSRAPRGCRVLFVLVPCQSPLSKRRQVSDGTREFFGFADQVIRVLTAFDFIAVSLLGTVMRFKRRPSGVIGAPPTVRPPTGGLVALIVLFGLQLPLFGRSLLAMIGPAHSAPPHALPITFGGSWAPLCARADWPLLVSCVDRRNDRLWVAKLLILSALNPTQPPTRLGPHRENGVYLRNPQKPVLL